MAVAIRGTNPVTAGVDTPATVSVTLSGSSQPQTGDLLLIIHCNDFYTLANMPTPTVGGSTSGVTNILDCDSGTNGAHARVWRYAVTSGGSDLTVSVTETGSADEDKAMIVYVLSGADNTTIDASGSAIDTGSTTHNCPSITTTTSDAYLICHTNTGGGASGGGAGSYTHPSGMTETVDNAFTAGMHVGGAVLQLSASGATGTKTFTPGSSVSDQANVSVAIKTGGAAAADSSAWTPARLPGVVGPDGQVFLTGSRYDDTGSASTQAPSGVAEGTGTAPQPTAAVGANAGNASGAGSAPQPVAAVRVNAGLAQADGTAPQPTVSVSGSTSAPAGLASASGSALQPTIAITVLPAAPAGTGSALAPTGRVAPNVGLAAASGSAFGATIAITVNAGAASGTGSAPQPTVNVSGSVNAPAGLASATGSALQPTVAVTVRAAVAAGTGSGLQATVITGRLVNAGVAAATGSAFAAQIRITVRPATATGVGQALAPSTTAEVPVLLRVLPLYSTRTFSADGYQTGENQTVWLPTNLRRGAPLLVVCHGTAAEASWYPESPERFRPLEAIANTGVVVIAGDLGEPANADGWGNDLSVSRVWQVATYAHDRFGCNIDRIHLRGESAGGATALNAARQRPSQTASVHLAAGVCDIEAIYQNGAGNAILVALIDLAYTAGGGWPAQRATHDPALNTAQLVPMADRIRCYYTPNDGLVPPQSTIDFTVDVGCELVPVGDMPHSDEVLTAINAGDLTDWIWDRN